MVPFQVETSKSHCHCSRSYEAPNYFRCLFLVACCPLPLEAATSMDHHGDHVLGVEQDCMDDSITQSDGDRQQIEMEVDGTFDSCDEEVQGIENDHEEADFGISTLLQ